MHLLASCHISIICRLRLPTTCAMEDELASTQHAFMWVARTSNTRGTVQRLDEASIACCSRVPAVNVISGLKGGMLQACVHSPSLRVFMSISRASPVCLVRK